MMFLSSDSILDGVPTLSVLKLRRRKADALRRTQESFLLGRQINALYICNHVELKTAEEKKLAWVVAVHGLLDELTEGTEASDFLDEIAINVLRDVDPIETHAEQFHNELNQRLERLRMVRKVIEQSSEPATESAAPKRSGSPIAQPTTAGESGTPPQAESAEDSSPSGAIELAVEDVPMITSQSTPSATAATKAAAPAAPAKATKILLILCSRNGTARQALCRFASQMNLTFEIVDYNPEQPSSIVGHIYRHRDAKFAIVYWGEPAGKELPGAAHPERYAGFTLGFALGRLGRGRVFVMGSTTAAPLPGFNHILVSQLDSGGGWQIQLARRIKAAGIDIDLNKLS